MGGPHIDTVMEDQSRESEEAIPLFADPVSIQGHIVEQAPRSRTPLLPAFTNGSSCAEEVQSPLQSPTIEAAMDVPVATTSNLSSSGEMRKSGGMITPPLSQRPSIASFQRSRASTGVNTSDIPPFLIAEEPSDKWSELLGHANFTIDPQPYQPDACDPVAWARFVQDWTKARSEYSLHRSSTERHFGASSLIFKWTEEKWAFVETEWKKCRDDASRIARDQGGDVHITAAEPAPLVVIPPLDDPRIVQSEQIIGPMEVGPTQELASKHTRRLSRKEQLISLFAPKTRLRTGF